MIRVRQLKINVSNDNNEFIKNKLLSILKISENELINYHIHKKSIDARKKPDIFFVYEIDVELLNEQKIIKKVKSNDIFISKKEEYQFTSFGNEEIKSRIVIVGCGPAGLFCGYFLAKHGYKPLIIDRGEQIDERVQSVENFWQNNVLNVNSNVQFGEGGAGTFSDGKLNTLVNDTEYRQRKIFEIFVENGASKSILYDKNPHIGTDVLRNVIKNIRKQIISYGGEFSFNTKLTDLIIVNNKIDAIMVNDNKEIKVDALVLAIGHSARDTFELLLNRNMQINPKPFAVGVRVQHSQELINVNQYGNNYSGKLPPANYKLTYTTSDGRGVYSFCMCPGGYVVNASSENNCLAINGMSNFKRDSKNANSAIVVTITPSDFGTNPLDGVKYQRQLEKSFYNLADGNIPIQLYKDFIDSKCSTNLLSLKPEIKGSYSLANVSSALPKYITDAINEAMPNFGKKIKGFDADEVLISGVESRTSSPIKILRDENGESNIKGIYPCGEGPGYAGGITSSAVDGIKIAELIAKKYSNRVV